MPKLVFVVEGDTGQPTPFGEVATAIGVLSQTVKLGRGCQAVAVLVRQTASPRHVRVDSSWNESRRNWAA